MAAMDMAAADLEKGTEEEAQGAPYAELDPVVAGGGGKELLVPDLHGLLPVEGGAAAGKTNLGRKKWFAYGAYWLLAAAASMIVLNNHVHTAPKYQLFPPELAMFVVFLCAIWLILRDMKKMM